MQCPECEKEITKVNVIVQAVQCVSLIPETNRTAHATYGRPDIQSTEFIECPLCCADITNAVEEDYQGTNYLVDENDFKYSS